jgi:uncharacterized membrane protein
MAALWRDLLRDLAKPEYVHVLLNPLPVYGLLVALAVFVAGWAARSAAAQAIGLAAIAVCAGSAWAAVTTGHAAYDRVYSMAEDEAQQWLNWHAYLGDRIVWVYTAAGAAALIALGALRWRPGWVRTARIGALVLALCALGSGAFLAFVGGKIRHAEFRHGPPPVRVPAQD